MWTQAADQTTATVMQMVLSAAAIIANRWLSCWPPTAAAAVAGMGGHQCRCGVCCFKLDHWECEHTV